MMFHSVAVSVIALVCYSGILFIVAHCLFLIAFCSDLENELLILNQSIETKINEKNKILPSRCIEIKKELCEIIQFQCDAKQLSGYSYYIPLEMNGFIRLFYFFFN